MLLLDTHVLLWWQANSDRLSARAARAIAAEQDVYVATISCWEVGMLLAKERIELDRDPYTWLRDLEASGVRYVDASKEASLAAGLLAGQGFEGDPADALIYATARELGVRLVTKDMNIRAHARTTRDVKTIW